MPRWLFCSLLCRGGFCRGLPHFHYCCAWPKRGGPQPVPLPPAVPAPVDKPYAGTSFAECGSHEPE